MDIGTKKEPGRILTPDEVHDTAGGHMDPSLEDPPPTDGELLGGGGPPPMDYSTP